MIDGLTDAIFRSITDRRQVAQVVHLAQGIRDCSEGDVDELFDRLLEFEAELESPVQPELGHYRVDQILQPVIAELVDREAKRNADPASGEMPGPWVGSRMDQIERLYQVALSGSDLRNHLLRLLATVGTESALELWADLICDDPPEHRLGIVLAFSPLMQVRFEPPVWLLEQLLKRGTAHSQIAPAIFDLCNFYFREGKLIPHPALPRVDQLTDLLGQLAGQLGKVEEGQFPAGFGVTQVNQLVSDSVALIVALCDTFAQLQYEPAIGKLHQAMSLRHRRVQTEAAAALARLGDEAGKAALIELAEQPVARLRVLAFAEELGFKDEISLELQGEIAIAESHLAIWLAEPEQMGLAPSNVEFLESREMLWPSYEHPVQCYLFQYSFGSGEQSHSNIAICGPLTHAFAQDIRHLDYDDIYAAFAGWQTVHQEIFQVSWEKAQRTFGNQSRSLLGALNAECYDHLEIKTAGSFFGELVLIADAVQEGEPGTAIADGQKVTWFGQGNENAPIDWQLAYAIWRGREMLASFNEQT